MNGFFARPTRLTSTVIFLTFGVALLLAVLGNSQQQQLLDIARNTEQAVLPRLLDDQRVTRRLDLLHRVGDELMFEHRAGEGRRRALAEARSLASQLASAHDPQVEALADETTALLAQVVAAGGDHADALQRWKRLSAQLTMVADRVATNAGNQVQRDADRIEEVAAQLHSRLRYILAAMALLVLLGGYLQRRQAGIEATLNESEVARARGEAENNLLRMAADCSIDTMIFAHAADVCDGLRLIYANAAFIRRLGRSQEEISALTISDFSVSSSAELAAQMAELRRAKKLHFETEYVASGGERIPVEVSLNYFEHDGKPLAVGYCRDVAETRAVAARMRALEVEAALRQHDLRYKEYFAAIADGVFMLDIGEDGRIFFSALNPALERMIGVCSAEALGKSARELELFPAEPTAFLLTQSRLCLDSAAPLNYEAKRDLPDGSVMHAAVTLVPLKDVAGRVYRIAGIARDISERVRLEHELRNAAATMRTFIDNIPDPAWIKDLNNCYLAVNQSFVRHVGAYEADDIVGKIDLDFLPEQVARANLVHDAQVVASGCRFTNEESSEDRDGREVWFEVVRSPRLDGKGEIVGSVGIAHDITVRRRLHALLEARESAFRSLAENLPAAIARYTPDARYTYVNSALERTTGMSRDDMISKTPMECFPDGRLADYQRHILAVARIGGDREVEMSVPMPDGAKQWHHVRFVAERNAQSGLVGVLAISSDITQRKSMEDAIAAGFREFRILADNLPDNIARWDTNGCYLYVNPTHERVLGASLAELIGKPLHDSHDVVKEALAQVVATGQAVKFVRQAALVGGVMEIHNVSLVPEFDEAGQIVSVLGIGRDMTDIYRMQESLAAREHEFRNLAESSPDVMIRVDRDLRIRYLNANMVKVLELGSAEEVIGRQSIEVWPDGRFNKIDALRERVVATGEMESVELVVPVPGGKMAYHHVISVPERDTDGHIIGTLTFGRDITVIRETERRLNSLVENLPGVVYTIRLSPQGELSFPYVSAGVEEMYGITPDAAMGDFAAMHDLVHPDDKVGMEAAFAESARAMTPFRVEVRVCPPGQPERWLDVRSDPEAQPDGGILWYGLIFDITARKQTETLLKRREREFRSLAENSPDVIVRYDRDCRRIYANPAHERRTKIGFAELLGRSPQEHWSLPTGPEGAAAFEANLRAVLASGLPREWKLSWTTADGDSAHMELLGVPEYDETEQVVGVLTLARDITARQAMEDRLRMAASVFETAGEGITITDPAGTILDVNPAFVRITGYAREEVVGRNPRLLSSGRHDRDFYAAMWRALTENGAWSGEIVNRRKSGELYTERLSIAAVKDARDRLLHYVAVFTDITRAAQAARTAAPHCPARRTDRAAGPRPAS